MVKQHAFQKLVTMNLAQQDAEFYGNEYFKMWQWRYADHSNEWQDCNKALSFNPDKEYQRKYLSGFPF